MLGRPEDEGVVALMRLIETQSRATLARWAADCARERYLPVYRHACPEDTMLPGLLETAESHLEGRLSRKELQAALRAAREIPKGLERDPAAQAAARAVITACGVAQTPTNALGFTFYGAAAAAYDRLGPEASEEACDAVAAEEFAALAAWLRAVWVPDETNPAGIGWNC